MLKNAWAVDDGTRLGGTALICPGRFVLSASENVIRREEMKCALVITAQAPLAARAKPVGEWGGSIPPAATA